MLRTYGPRSFVIYACMDVCISHICIVYSLIIACVKLILLIILNTLKRSLHDRTFAVLLLTTFSDYDYFDISFLHRHLTPLPFSK